MSKPRFECDVCGADRESVWCNGNGCFQRMCPDCLKWNDYAEVKEWDTGSYGYGDPDGKRYASAEEAIQAAEADPHFTRHRD